MQRYIVTGTPGAGKTTLIGELARLGHATIPEAATELIAVGQGRGVDKPWEAPHFIADIARLQRHRRLSSHGEGRFEFHDRSAVCTLALCRYIDRPVPAVLAEDIGDLLDSGWFEPRVLFVANIGFVEPTAARRISFEQSLEFERLHVEAYRECGFELELIPAGPVGERLSRMRDVICDT